MSQKSFDAIIIGGSYAGLSAALSLGRSLRKALVIDRGLPCNRFAPQSHNFITHDGTAPGEIAGLAREQIEAKYDTVKFLDDLAETCLPAADGSGFEVTTKENGTFQAKKIILAIGVRDRLFPIPEFAACWGISVVHCPYCHGYEWKGSKTGIFGNGGYACETAKIIFNWTKDLTIFTNGPSEIPEEMVAKMKVHNIKIVEDEIEALEHTEGKLHHLLFKNGERHPLQTLYAQPPFELPTLIPQELGCELTEHGHVLVDGCQRTSVDGVYGAGDMTTFLRAVAHAVAGGNLAGSMVNKELIEAEF
jgi:thioredoxin reductase